MVTGTVMFEAKNSFAFLSQSYQLESHTLADSRQIQYTAVGSKERQMMLSHEPSYLFGGVSILFRVFFIYTCTDFGFQYLIQFFRLFRSHLSVNLFFLLFLH